jgi:hypothetical protein
MYYEREKDSSFEGLIAKATICTYGFSYTIGGNDTRLIVANGVSLDHYGCYQGIRIISKSGKRK